MSTIGSRGTHQREVMPHTASGRWSVASFVVLLLGATVLFAAATSGQTGGEAIFDNLWLGIPGILGLVGATISMITGLIAVIRRHERAITVVFAVIVSTLVFMFVALSVLLG